MTDTACSEDGAAAMTLREELRAGTAAAHRELERDLDLLRPGFSRDDFRRLLLRYHGFFAPFERFLDEMAGHGSPAAQFYCRGRRKRAWLESDLLALGVQIAPRDSEVPDERFASLFPSEAHLLGAMYVIEGSMLGAAILSRHFMKRLQMTPDTGLRFFSGYGQAGKEQWQAMLHFLQERDGPIQRRPDVVDGAKRMFLLLKQQLLDGPASVRHGVACLPS